MKQQKPTDFIARAVCD